MREAFAGIARALSRPSRQGIAGRHIGAGAGQTHYRLSMCADSLSITVASVSSAIMTRQLMSWEPSGPTLFEDLEAGHYTD